MNQVIHDDFEMNQVKLFSKISERDECRSVFVFIDCKNKCLLNKNGWGTYAAYPRMANIAGFIYSWEKAVSGALWVTFLGQKRNVCD